MAETLEVIGQSFADASGRTLRVTEVNHRSDTGRQIVGRIVTLTGWDGVHDEQDYATDEATFDAIWVRRVPAWDGTGKQYG